MLTFASKYAMNIHSQNGEDGIIDECLKRINPKVKTAVEFGAPSFYYCSNTAYLADQGWDVKMFDIDDNIDARIHKAFITPDNVNELVGSPTVLSIDVDGQDYHIWSAYNEKKPLGPAPALVIIEINSGVDPDIEMIPGDRGASFRSMCLLASRHAYRLVCHTGNLIFVHGAYFHLFPELSEHGNSDDYIISSHLYFNRSFLC